MSSFKKSWKQFLLLNKELEVSNNYFRKIKELSDPDIAFKVSFAEISKNQGISFICVDPTESFIQLLHNCHVLRGGWDNPSKILVSILGTDKTAKPIQLILKSVKSLKAKTDSLEELMNGDLNEKTKSKSTKVDFLFRNILPIPHVLTKAYLELDSHTPQDVAQAFYNAMKEFDSSELNVTNEEVTQIPPLVEENDQDHNKKTGEDDDESKTAEQNMNVSAPKGLLQEFMHVLQFCHLSFKKKIPPVAYSADTNPMIDLWFQAVSFSNLEGISNCAKRHQQRNDDSSDSDDDVSSPECKISKRDRVFLSTMLKINDAMGKNTKEKLDKEPGFSQIEEHSKNLILNASSLPPYDTPATQPTEFLRHFWQRKASLKQKICFFTAFIQIKFLLTQGHPLSKICGTVIFSGFCQILRQV
jgi:hypothetical protein